MRIIYIGNELRITHAIDSLLEYDVVAICCQPLKAVFKPDRYGNIPLLYVETKSDLTASLRALANEADFAVMYSFGIIVPQEAIDIMPIYNFHPGNLRDNRGSSPINWAILLNFETTTMTMHEVVAEIDAGQVVCEHHVPVYNYDVPTTLRYRLEGEIPSMLLNFAHSSGTPISPKPPPGVYRQRIQPEDYTINAGDSEVTIKAKIRSQYEFQGARMIVDGEPCFIKNYQQYLRLVDSH